MDLVPGLQTPEHRCLAIKVLGVERGGNPGIGNIELGLSEYNTVDGQPERALERIS